MPRRSPRSRYSFGKFVLKAFAFLILVLGAFLAWHVFELNRIVHDQFAGKRWSLPSRVYARPLDLYTGMRLAPGQLAQELSLLGFSPSGGDRPGSFLRNGDDMQLTTRRFVFHDGEEPSRSLRLRFAGERVADMKVAGMRGTPMPVRIEPMQIGTIYPQHHEDRVLVRLEEWPPLLSATLQAVEDRRFADHPGIDWLAVMRAAWANIVAGRVAQGGSTLTQQLVKNFFLSNERTLSRKFNEAIMALLLEAHYGKDEILEAYGNEIYLGQDGARAIHGFGLASEFYFQKPVGKLGLPEIALLVGMLRGPAYYDPRQHPARALERRNQVIEILASLDIISAAQAEEARFSPLGVMSSQTGTVKTYPAFVDVVRRQLEKDYRAEDLRSEGLRIFTTLDPLVQQSAERALQSGLAELEKGYRLDSGSLQGSAVITRVGSAEVAAVVGGRDARYAGFNRAVDARRPIGSLVKPAVYLNALGRAGQYHLLSLVDDVPVALPQPDGALWKPQNFDRKVHGQVPLYQALGQSYNLSTINLGQNLGVRPVIETLNLLGVEKDIAPYPSLFLGAVSLSPMEVAQMYQTIADEGFHTPLRTVREVVTGDGRLLQRYPLETRQRFDEVAVYLLSRALQEGVRRGTGRNLPARLPADMTVAGKTGTTDDLRDSWFAGFTGDLLGVVWVGRDDNQPAQLTGAGGAMLVWGDIMHRARAAVLVLTPPASVVELSIDPVSGLRADRHCPDAFDLPFIEGTEPQNFAPCAGSAVGRSVDRTIDWIKKALE